MPNNNIRVSLKNVIAPPIPMAVLMVLGVVLVWIAGFGYESKSATVQLNSPLAAYLQQFVLTNHVLSNILGAIITLLNAFLIAQLNNKFTIIRTRSFLPVFIFTMLIASWPSIHMLLSAHLALTLLIMSLFVFFEMYRDRNASEQAFLGSLLIATASLFIEPFILFIPVCWIGFMRFYSFSLRTFLASIFGALVPWVFFLAMRIYFQPDLLWLNSLATGFYVGVPFIELPLNEFVYMACTAIIIVIGLAGLFSNLHSDSIQTRAKLNFLLFLLIAAFIFSMIFIYQFLVFLPVIALCYALLISHPFTLRSTNFYGILFIVFIVVNVAFVISNIILN